RPLALVAHQVARERQPVRTATEERPDQREWRTRIKTAADRKVMAVADARDGILEGRELVSAGFRLVLETQARGLEVELLRADRHVTISHLFWYRSSCSTVYGSSG